MMPSPRYRRDCRSVVSLVLVGLLAGASFPAFGQQNPVAGSVSAVGAVQLRGVPISSEGTLFNGDRIETSGDAYVKVQFTDGSQLELGDDTDVRVDVGESTLQVAMNRGRVAFSSLQPVSVSVESFRIEGTGGAAAEVAFLAPNRLSVTALTESLTVTQVAAQETEPVEEGQQVIIDLDAEVGAPDAQPPEQTGGPAGSGDGSSATWILVGAGAGGGAGAAIFLAKRGRDSASQSQP
jgi:ferric-dicitrate binding protein FerR (iron transport regulator)